APVASVTVTLNSSVLTVGQTTQAVATLYDVNGQVLTGRTITWSSTAPSLASVSPSGVVTALVTAEAAGTVVIVATSETKSGNAGLTISAPAAAPVASVTIALTPNAIQKGQTSQSSVTLKDAS